jgi:hypothetical protein
MANAVTMLSAISWVIFLSFMMAPLRFLAVLFVRRHAAFHSLRNADEQKCAPVDHLFRLIPDESSNPYATEGLNEDAHQLEEWS